MDKVLDYFWSKVPRHAIDLCKRTILIGDEERSVKAAVVDGCNATKDPKRKVHEGISDLPNLADSREKHQHNR